MVYEQLGLAAQPVHPSGEGERAGAPPEVLDPFRPRAIPPALPRLAGSSAERPGQARPDDQVRHGLPQHEMLQEVLRVPAGQDRRCLRTERGEARREGLALIALAVSAGAVPGSAHAAHPWLLKAASKDCSETG